MYPSVATLFEGTLSPGAGNFVTKN